MGASSYPVATAAGANQISKTMMAAAAVVTAVLLLSPLAAAEPWKYCGSSGMYSGNSTYQASLDAVSVALPRAASSTRALFATAAAGSGTVFALALCRGDGDAPGCQDCVAEAFRYAVESCPYDKEVAVLYDACFLYFSGQNFLATTDNAGQISLLYNGNSTQNAVDDDPVFTRHVRAMINATARAAAYSVPWRFATARMYGGSLVPTLYALTQCTPDLSPADCWACLEDLIEKLPSSARPVGGRIAGARCSYRYEDYTFYSGEPMLNMRALSSAATLCSDDAVKDLVEGVTAQLWRSNALMVLNAILVAIMVAAGASGPRYSHAAVTRFLFQGASTLYLPIVSYVASSIGKESCSTSGLDVFCHGRSYVALLLIWLVLVQIVGTSAIVVAQDHYDGGGQKLGPSIQLLARMFWTLYLVFYYADCGFRTIISKSYTLDNMSYYRKVSQILIVLCLLSLAKMMLKMYALRKVQRSFALGRKNPRLVAGYMEKLFQGEDQLIPPLILMGEDMQEIEETPQGYSIKQRNRSLVTLDMVWQKASAGDAFLWPRSWLKDLCLSFALFKLLRRRFQEKVHLAESGSARAFNFVSDVLLNSASPDRVFSVVADEISFVLDSSHSSLPTYNSGRLLPILNITVSLSIITWCLVGSTYISHHFSVSRHPNQIFCLPNPESCSFPPKYLNDGGRRIAFGNILFNALPTTFLVVAVVVAEVWEIVSYLCSNWVKVKMLCNYVTHATWQGSPRVQGWLGLVMKLRLRRSWSDRMGQRSLLLEGWLPRWQQRHVKVPAQVKAAIVAALRDSNGTLSKGTTALHNKTSVGGSFLWACQGEGTSDVILTWHIATRILEMEATASSAGDQNAVVARSLSRYCAYLVAAAPELLPDDEAWSKKLYKTVGMDIRRALAGKATDGGMAARLERRSEQEVVRKGAKLGKQLLELIPNNEVARWDLLAAFWSEMVLYLAPSDNVKAHKKAIARGTELLTLVWALLTHAGIVTRPGAAIRFAL